MEKMEPERTKTEKKMLKREKGEGDLGKKLTFHGALEKLDCSCWLFYTAF